VSNVEYEEFYHFFQPLYALSSEKIFGYECLIRSKHFNNPELFFEKAKEENKRHELDMKSIKKAMDVYFQNEMCDALLFINIFPSTLLHPTFQSFITTLTSNKRIIPTRVVFEIIEEEVDLVALKKEVVHLKSLGFRIAIDDVGKGAASLESIIELQPQFVKMDKYFSTDLSQSSLKQRMIKTLLNYCVDDLVLILEGIEYDVDLLAAKKLGVAIGQGYLLGRPDFLENALIPNKLSFSNLGSN
jgi:EAL domain-containing protein (putative c-di-GMP-specific phosphodiesterase class I)